MSPSNRIVGIRKMRNRGIAHLKVAPNTSSLRRVDRIGYHGIVVSQPSGRGSKEHCLYSCGSLVLRD